MPPPMMELMEISPVAHRFLKTPLFFFFFIKFSFSQTRYENKV